MLFAIIVTLIPILIGLAISWPMIRQMARLQKAREGKRTKFVIDTTDKGYADYQKKIDKWLEDVGFGKYKARKNGRYLKYYKNGNIYKCGFHYYRQGSRLIIDAWLCVLGKESPLTFVSYWPDGNNQKGMPTALDQHAKEQYLEVLNTIITVPQIVGEVNEVTLQYNIAVSDFKTKQKAERTSNWKMIWGIIIFAFLVSILINCFGK